MQIKESCLYVALLRGINVGGNSMVSMKDLKDCFGKLGFRNVSTYINSGNVIFTSSHKTEQGLASRIEQGIKKCVGFEVRVVVRSLAEIAAVCKKIPKVWTHDASSRTDVLFLWKEVDRPSVLSELVINTAVDHLLYVKGAVVWHFDRRDYNKSKMHKFIGTFVYKNMTARNVNTVRKLYALMTQLATGKRRAN